MDYQKDLEAIREAAADVSSQINRVIFFRSASMILLLILMIRALTIWNGAAVKDQIHSIHDLAQPFPGHIIRPRLDLISLLSPPDETSYTPYVDPPKDEALKEAASQIDSKVAALRDSYWGVFGVSVSFLGTSIQFDLRIVLLALPIFGPLANLYIAALWLKRRALLRIGQHRLSCQAANEVLVIDSITFREPIDSWLFRYPPAILNAAFWASAATLGAICIYFAAQQAKTDNRDIVITLINVTLAAFLGAFHWERNIESRIAREVFEQTGIEVSPDPLYAWVTRCRKKFLAGIAWASPSWASGTGSVLILATLGLSIGQTGCDQYPEKGYHVVVGKIPTEDGQHEMDVSYAAELSLPGSDYPGETVARCLYILFLVISFVVPFNLLFRKLRLRHIKFSLPVILVAPPMAFVVLALHASSSFLPLGTWMVYAGGWSARFLYLAQQVRRGKAEPSDCESTALTCFEILVIPVGCTLAIYSAKFPGLPVMTTGVVLMTCGAYSAWKRLQPERMQNDD